jgi:serine/threonine protein kinase
MLGILNSKYELVELAGEGGMAHVYRGYTLGAEGFRRPVAVKRILEGFADNAEFLEMFVEEARVSATIHHPNVVQIHDFDRDDAGHFYLVMEWVPGVNLLDWCEGHRLRGSAHAMAPGGRRRHRGGSRASAPRTRTTTSRAGSPPSITATSRRRTCW